MSEAHGQMSGDTTMPGEHGLMFPGAITMPGAAHGQMLSLGVATDCQKSSPASSMPVHYGPRSAIAVATPVVSGPMSVVTMSAVHNLMSPVTVTDSDSGSSVSSAVTMPGYYRHDGYDAQLYVDEENDMRPILDFSKGAHHTEFGDDNYHSDMYITHMKDDVSCGQSDGYDADTEEGPFIPLPMPSHNDWVQAKGHRVSISEMDHVVSGWISELVSLVLTGVDESERGYMFQVFRPFLSRWREVLMNTYRKWGKQRAEEQIQALLAELREGLESTLVMPPQMEQKRQETEGFQGLLENERLDQYEGTQQDCVQIGHLRSEMDHTAKDGTDLQSVKRWDCQYQLGEAPEGSGPRTVVEGPKDHQQLDSYQVIETEQTETAVKVAVSGNEKQVPQQVVKEIEVEKESLLNQAIYGTCQEGSDDVELDNDMTSDDLPCLSSVQHEGELVCIKTPASWDLGMATLGTPEGASVADTECGTALPSMEDEGVINGIPIPSNPSRVELSEQQVVEETESEKTTHMEQTEDMRGEFDGDDLKNDRKLLYIFTPFTWSPGMIMSNLHVFDICDLLFSEVPQASGGPDMDNRKPV
jgi:hypothetical protein